MDATTNNNYVVGRGEVYFDRFADGTTTGSGEMYFGNTPNFQVTPQVTNLDHYDSDHGLKVKDMSVMLQADLNGQFVTDNISEDNLALWFLGVTADTLLTAQTGATQQITAKLGRYYQLGVSATMPQGVTNVANVIVTKNGATVPASGNLDIDLTLGRVYLEDNAPLAAPVASAATPSATGGTLAAGSYFYKVTAINALGETVGSNEVTATTTGSTSSVAVTWAAVTGATGYKVYKGSAAGAESSYFAVGAVTSFTDTGTAGTAGTVPASNTTGGTISDGDVLTVTYDVVAGTRNLVIGEGNVIYGALRFIAKNPVGQKTNYFFPYVKLSPTSNFDLKGDQWQQCTFSVEVLKMSGKERVYAERIAA